MAKRKTPDPYSEEVILRERRFPIVKTVLLPFLLTVQLFLILFACLYSPKPQDKIDRYEITLSPREDGSLDIDYRFVWTALDTSEELTWVEIGMPNRHFDFDKSSFSDTIASAEKYVDEDYVSARLYLDRAYRGGETLVFSFRVHQRMVLSQDGGGYLYEFVPGWFNSTPVEYYRFVFRGTPAPQSENANRIENGDAIWEGSMPCGTYVTMRMHYGMDTFLGKPATTYTPFNGAGVEDALAGDKVSAVVMTIVFCLVILLVEIYLVDSLVSYRRGRGFLTGYGFHVHTYGYTNPHYRAAKAAHSSSSGGGGGRGCACACACACAGGGRAGCSQKDTTAFPIKQKE